LPEPEARLLEPEAQLVTDVTNSLLCRDVLCRERIFEMGGTYRDLEAWQCARALVVEIYRSTASFPREEMFGLTSQLRRAAVSVASNIAEGKGRFSDRELSQFLSVSRGSVFEIETQVTIALDLGFLTESQSQTLLKRCGEVGRLLNGLIKAVRKPAA
jgi:four helix bundle protein